MVLAQFAGLCASDVQQGFGGHPAALVALDRVVVERTRDQMGFVSQCAVLPTDCGFDAGDHLVCHAGLGNGARRNVRAAPSAGRGGDLVLFVESDCPDRAYFCLSPVAYPNRRLAVVAPSGRCGGCQWRVDLAAPPALGPETVIRLGIFLRGTFAGGRFYGSRLHENFLGGRPLPVHRDSERDSARGRNVDRLAPTGTGHAAHDSCCGHCNTSWDADVADPPTMPELWQSSRAVSGNVGKESRMLDGPCQSWHCLGWPRKNSRIDCSFC